MKFPNYKEYIELEEYRNMISLLEKGIAIHHSGVMPVLREMVELLFEKGYIKLLFATETFAVGINMPTKTVLFTALSKFTGGGFRNLLSHEYTQMAGRAGRRGIDTLGYVIHLNNMFKLPSVSEYKVILNGHPQKLTSKFCIDFNLILQLISTNSSDFTSFTSKSMICDEINAEYKMCKDKYTSLEEAIKKRISSFKPEEHSLLIRYHDIIKHLIPHSKNKRKKKLQRELLKIKGDIRDFDTLYEKYIELDKMKEDHIYYETQTFTIQHHIQTNINNVLDLLMTTNFVDKTTDGYILTKTGIYATQLQEVNCLAFAESIKEDIFNDVTSIELASILSSFTNLRVSDDIKESVCNCSNKTVVDWVTHIEQNYYGLYDLELKTLQSVNENNYTMNFDLNDIIINWCNASNEDEM